MAGRTSEDQADPPTVLVVEDEVLIRMSTADYLRGCGYHIIEVGSGDEAVAVLKADVRIDVVFTDVSMPGNLKWLRPCPVGAQRTTRREGDPDLRSYQNRQGSPGSLCAWPARGEAVRAQRSGPAHPGTSPAPLIGPRHCRGRARHLSSTAGRVSRRQQTCAGNYLLRRALYRCTAASQPIPKTKGECNGPAQ